MLLAVVVLGFIGAALIFFVRKDCVIGSNSERINTPFWARPFCREEYESLVSSEAVMVTLREGASNVDYLERFFFEETGRRPMIVPVVVEV